MRFKNFLKESKDVGVTSFDEGHKHEFAVDRWTGHGATSKDKGHFHPIRKFIVLPAGKNGHIHTLEDLTY
jgi:hypothetical protein